MHSVKLYMGTGNRECDNTNWTTEKWSFVSQMKQCN